MIVNPAPGALVRDPVTKLAIEDGTVIDPTDPYWSRALADGDVLPVDGDDAPPATTRRRPSTPIEAVN